MASLKPEWCARIAGVPIHCVARLPIKGDSPQQISVTGNRISLGREGSFDFDYIYGPESSNKDIVSRTLGGFLERFLDGYNISVVALGPSGSGKKLTLDGSERCDRNSRGEVPGGGNGIVHSSIDKVFQLLNEKSEEPGQNLGKEQKSGQYDFYVESGFVSVQDEICTDLLRGDAKEMEVVELPSCGYCLHGLKVRRAKSAMDLRRHYNTGRIQRDRTGSKDGGDRAATIFTIHLFQFMPPKERQEEPSVLISRLMFVELPGTEILSIDPDDLRLRDGIRISKAPLALSRRLMSLAADKAANIDESNLTKLTADVFGGNCYTAVIGTLEEDSKQPNRTTMVHLRACASIQNFPIQNQDRVRGFVQTIRQRIVFLKEDRDLLKDRLGAVPSEGDPEDTVVSFARIRDLQARLEEERDNNADLIEENEVLQVKLQRKNHLGDEEMRSKTELHEALVESEEQRLEISRALVEFQIDHNEMKEGYEGTVFELEQRILDLEAKQLTNFVKTEEYKALEERFEKTDNELLETQHELQSEQRRLAEINDELHALQNKEVTERSNASTAIRGDTSSGGDNNTAGSLRPTKDIRIKDSLIKDLRSDLKSTHWRLQETSRDLQAVKARIDKCRIDHANQLKIHLQEFLDLSNRLEIVERDTLSDLKPEPKEVFVAIQRVATNISKTAADGDQDLRNEIEQICQRNIDQRRKYQALSKGYRALRYHLEDILEAESEGAQTVPHEDEVLDQYSDSFLQEYSVADQNVTNKLQLGSNAPVPRQLELNPKEQDTNSQNLLKFENERLRSELDRLRKVDVRTPLDTVKRENEKLKSQLKAIEGMDRSRAQLGYDIAKLQEDNAELRAAATKTTNIPALRTQIKEFTINTQMELEASLQRAESRAAMAEEQLTSLQSYLAKATVVYQREIVRLRGIVQANPKVRPERRNSKPL